ncbi:K(+) efflux antiporter 5 [Auxenochlorella protothecoides]|uniref:K(+) efflux antiporter 5 n=1 Tax=Auxenochlorella protothecoides TaxID=3075 RepID=A0A087STJ4_AUXPR|nr:K(+) efflux antiporter 5 [Auxenochlorella protothecoides]KFM29048.1 K(+) efflux antiporter 5 [Auxenochlorella protothecoides]
MARRATTRWHHIPILVLLYLCVDSCAAGGPLVSRTLLQAGATVPGIPDTKALILNTTAGNGTEKHKDTIAHILDEALREEFKHEEEKSAEQGSEYNKTAQAGDYVLSKAGEEGGMGITLDPRLVKDLTVLIAACALMGMAMEAVGQPTINGYFIAGSVVGPGALNWVSEPVQVQSLAQLGVQLLLFSLGLEFSLAKLRAVRDVALLGGALQVALLSGLSAGVAAAIGTSPSLGAFVGALAGMSSTSIVVKCLSDRRCQHSASGQIVVGTLVIQDCMLGGAVAVAAALSRLVLPRAAGWVARHASAEIQALAGVGACCCAALVTTRLGISAELGAFMAGATLAAAGVGAAIHARLDAITHFFLALFISSTGMVLAPPFLLHHLPVLAAGAALVVLVKGLVVGGVVLVFGYGLEVAAGVGLALAQVGEFVFVLLSLAHGQELLATQVYLLLMGITALSLLVTPFLLQLSMRLGTGQSWLAVAPSEVQMAGFPDSLTVRGRREPLVSASGKYTAASCAWRWGSGVSNMHRTCLAPSPPAPDTPPPPHPAPVNPNVPGLASQRPQRYRTSPPPALHPAALDPAAGTRKPRSSSVDLAAAV